MFVAVIVPPETVDSNATAPLKVLAPDTKTVPKVPVPGEVMFVGVKFPPTFKSPVMVTDPLNVPPVTE